MTGQQPPELFDLDAEQRPVDRVLTHLEGVKAHAGGWQARCPAHDDQNPSLSVAEADGGKVLLYCHAGCSFAEIARALGLEERDLFGRGGKPPKDREIVALYDYRDDAGALLYQTVRYDPKEFKQRRPGGNGSWTWDLKGTRRILYCLPEVLAADPSSWVFIVEGEKSADAITSLGLLATSAPLGAGKWRGVDQTPLQGRYVAVLPDDDPQGQAHAIDVVTALKDVAARRRIVKLPAVTFEKSDPADWVAAGGTKADLLALVEETPDVADPQGPSAETLLRHGAEDDEGNAQTVAELYGREFLHCPALGWLHWTGTHWDRDTAEAALDRAVVETLKLRRAAAVAAEQENVVKTAKPSAYRVHGCKCLLTSILVADVADFDASPDHLNCQNGVVDLRVGELAPHDPGQRFTYCLPVDFDLSADQSEWLAFLRDVLGDDPGMLTYVQEAAGYSATGHTSEEILFYVEGPTRAGKGTFTETFKAMLGHRPLADEVDFGTFTAERAGDTQNFDLAGLKATRFIVASESRQYQQLNAAKIKNLTGGNEIRCAHKHRPFFSYRPAFKIWLVSNHPVNADVDDDAAWYRVRVIRFPHSFAGGEDRGLKARLRRPENLRGVLAWAVLGAIAWYGRGAKGLPTPEVVTAATETARRELDFVGQWLDECIETSGNEADFMTNAAIYASYAGWADENGVTPKKKRALTLALRRKGIDAGQRKSIEGKTWRGCYGVKLRRVSGDGEELPF